MKLTKALPTPVVTIRDEFDRLFNQMLSGGAFGPRHEESSRRCGRRPWTSRRTRRSTSCAWRRRECRRRTSRSMSTGRR